MLFSPEPTRWPSMLQIPTKRSRRLRAGSGVGICDCGSFSAMDAPFFGSALLNILWRLLDRERMSGATCLFTEKRSGQALVPTRSGLRPSGRAGAIQELGHRLHGEVAGRYRSKLFGNDWE